MAFLFFPGTLIHELSHYLAAHLLFVRVSHMEFIPRLEGTHVKLGSVSIERTDPIRRLLIGAAPFAFGTSLLLGGLYNAARYDLFNNTFFLILIGYFVFEISNTMFSSRKDMGGALELSIISLLLIGIFYFFSINLPFSLELNTVISNPTLVKVFEKGSIFLLIPLGINSLTIIIFKLLRL